MAWYEKFFNGSRQLEPEEKLNPAQPYYSEKVINSKEFPFSYAKAYEDLEIVNRGVNMIIDDAAEIPVTVGDSSPGTPVVKGVKKTRVNILLNHEPNLFQDISTFRRDLITDYLLDGNIFVYYDKAHLYHLPASKMVVHASEKSYVKKYTFQETVDFSPDEIIHVKENSFSSLYRGTSRLKAARRTMELMLSMRTFQDNFFKNGAVPGLIIKSPNTLSEKIKARLIDSWVSKYRPDSGGRRPLILDGGLEIDTISNINFKELDFQPSISANENVILKALGVPPIMMDSGNNANIRPNHRLYYLETVLPIVGKINSAFERYFGFLLTPYVINIPALQPELRDQSQYLASLVNGGILTPNEARMDLGRPPDKDEESNKLRIPANIAGSAVNPDLGGKPPKDKPADGAE